MMKLHGLDRLLFFSLSVCLTPQAFSADSFAEALAGGDANLSFRYRFETVDQDGAQKDANASTLKTRLNFKTLSYNGLGFFIEVDDVSYLGNTNFRNTRNNKPEYPVVADPRGTDINQLYVNYDTDAANLRLGRQRINMDNQRFIGGVGWRQNEQTYDGLSIASKSLEKVTINYAYIDEVQRIFGPDTGTPPEDLQGDTHLFNANLDLADYGKLTLYSYAMDFDDAAGLSNHTTGARYVNTFDAVINTTVTAEYAHQGNHGDNPASYSANYYLLSVALKSEKTKVTLGYEVLQGDNDPGKAFRTPLATLHKFQGWADKFLTTPDAGIENAYITFGYTFSYGKFALTWHDFDAEASSASYGSELDVSFAHKFNEHYSLLLKAADYDADKHSTDTTKVWLMFTAKF